MTFFFDNDISPKLVEGLSAFGEDVVHLSEVFDVETPDVVWLKSIGNRGWFLITHDKNIRKNKMERDALKSHGVGAFFLGGKNMSAWQRIKQVVRAWEQIKQTADTKDPPFAYVVRRSGRKLIEVPLD